MLALFTILFRHSFGFNPANETSCRLFTIHNYILLLGKSNWLKLVDCVEKFVDKINRFFFFFRVVNFYRNAYDSKSNSKINSYHKFRFHVYFFVDSVFASAKGSLNSISNKFSWNANSNAFGAYTSFVNAKNRIELFEFTLVFAIYNVKLNWYVREFSESL